MWRNWSKEWERQKSYLIRSLFEDLSRLSPISETNELRSNLYDISSAEASSRPYSPLPDLIIEREKNRHDEPKEFYQVLEKKMLKLYRKLFCDVEYESNSGDDSYTKIIEFDDNETDCETLVAEIQARNNQHSASSNVEVDTDDSGEIETMRRDKCDSKSLGSTPEYMMSGKKSLTPVIEMEKEMSLMENITQSDESIAVTIRDTGTELESDEVQEMTMNTLQHPENSEKSNRNISPLKRVSSDSWSDIAEDPPSKIKRYVTKEIQTSPLPDAEVVWDDLRTNFFQGTPLVYNLCNCENHV